MKKKAYGFCYTKSGNLVEVNSPVNGKGKKVKSSNKTVTGKIGRGVGHSNFNS